MDRTELVAITLVGAILVVLPLGAYYYQVNRVVEAMAYGQTVEITASTFENGGWFPDKIVVKKGEPVRFIIHGADIAHSLVVPELGVDSKIVKPGHAKTIEFVPEKEGIFTIYCGIPCSPLHSNMRGKLIVVG